MNKQLFYLGRLSRVLWLRAALYAAAAVVAALVAHALGPLAPDYLVRFVGEDTTEEILKIMASSMLAVAAFSVTALVTVYGTVTSQASPRAAARLIEDRSAQAALATFIGAFIFSVVALTALGTGYYDPASRFVLFVETLAVLALVVLRLLRWIDQLSKMGQVVHAIDQIEAATRDALKHRPPFLGGRPAEAIPPDAQPLTGSEVGYVQHVDVSRLDRLAEDHGLRLHLAVLPGAFVRRSRPLLHVEHGAPLTDELRRKLLDAVVIGGSRTFQQDPRFGLVVLSEIASRALSPGINDPGTAIDVVGTAVRLLSTWGERHWEEEPQVKHPRVLVPGLSAADCFEDVFAPVERDGARYLEVGIALQKAYRDLSSSEAPGFAEAARKRSRRALERARRALEFEDDAERLRELAEAVS